MDMTPGKPFLHRRGKSGLHIAGKVFFPSGRLYLTKSSPPPSPLTVPQKDMLTCMCMLIKKAARWHFKLDDCNLQLIPTRFTSLIDQCNLYEYI